MTKSVIERKLTQGLVLRIPSSVGKILPECIKVQKTCKTTLMQPLWKCNKSIFLQSLFLRINFIKFLTVEPSNTHGLQECYQNKWYSSSLVIKHLKYVYSTLMKKKNVRITTYPPFSVQLFCDCSVTSLVVSLNDINVFLTCIDFQSPPGRLDGALVEVYCVYRDQE